MSDDRYSLVEVRDRALAIGEASLAADCDHWLCVRAYSHRYLSSLPRTPGAARPTTAAPGQPRSEARRNSQPSDDSEGVGV